MYSEKTLSNTEANTVPPQTVSRYVTNIGFVKKNIL